MPIAQPVEYVPVVMTLPPVAVAPKAAPPATASPIATLSASAVAVPGGAVSTAARTPGPTILPVRAVSPLAAPGLPSLDAAMSSVLAQGYPGGSLAVVRDGRLVYARGYGFARDGVAATATTRYRQASVSKAVTRSLLAKLVAGGVLSLSLRVFPYLGITPVDGRASAITVGMLRDHTTGISADLLLSARDAATFYGVPSPPDVDTMIRWTARQMLASAPGSKYSYNNTNYGILTRIMEKATGRRWIDLATEMTQPIGVSSWRMDSSPTTPADEPRYYEVDKHRFMPSVFDGVPGMVEAAYGGYDAAVLGGATALVSTVIDMARYAQGVSTGTIRAPEPDPIPTKPGWSYTYIYNGSMPGHYTFLMRIWDGTNLTVLAGAFNHRDAGAMDQTINGRMLDAYKATTSWPTVDLFPNH
jgi:CubicO group peptidase (beta-lactamase class C family)